MKDNCGCDSAKKASGQIPYIKRDFYLLLVMGRFQDILVLCIFTVISEDWLIHETPLCSAESKGEDQEGKSHFHISFRKLAHTLNPKRESTRKESHVFTFFWKTGSQKPFLFIHENQKGKTIRKETPRFGKVACAAYHFRWFAKSWLCAQSEAHSRMLEWLPHLEHLGKMGRNSHPPSHDPMFPLAPQCQSQ